MAPGQENATLKERCFQKDWCLKKMLEQMQNVRGEPVIMGLLLQQHEWIYLMISSEKHLYK